MSVGRLWCFQTSLANVIARSVAILLSFLRGIKCAIFVKRSMTTHNWLCPPDSGNSVMKSIAIDCHSA